jgi:two-component system CheB/CheR fusion protein
MGAQNPKNLDAAGEALRASELRYRRLFESAKDGILILDAETGMIVDVNPFLIELLGISRKAFLDKKVWELGFLKDIAANETKFAELRAQE